MLEFLDSRNSTCLIIRMGKLFKKGGLLMQIVVFVTVAIITYVAFKMLGYIAFNKPEGFQLLLPPKDEGSNTILILGGITVVVVGGALLYMSIPKA